MRKDGDPAGGCNGPMAVPVAGNAQAEKYINAYGEFTARQVVHNQQKKALMTDRKCKRMMTVMTAMPYCGAIGGCWARDQ